MSADPKDPFGASPTGQTKGLNDNQSLQVPIDEVLIDKNLAVQLPVAPAGAAVCLLCFCL